MEIIRGPLSEPRRGVIEVLLPVDRQTVEKLRWRGTAEDRREFGFDLAVPLPDGAAFFYSEGTRYIVAQQPESVLQIAFSTPADAARIGWLVGNLHFPLEISPDAICVVDDTAIRQMLLRENIQFSEVSRVFHPFRHGHVH
jgi:urease accessory protein